MDFLIPWTAFAVEAEFERTGGGQLAGEHNKLHAEAASLRKDAERLRDACACEIASLQEALSAYETMARNVGAVCEGKPNATALALAFVTTRRNAERYLWLRDGHGLGYWQAHFAIAPENRDSQKAAEVDNNIDAARAIGIADTPPLPTNAAFSGSGKADQSQQDVISPQSAATHSYVA